METQFFVCVQMRDYSNKSPFATYREAEAWANHFRHVDEETRFYRRVWIETDKGEEVLPLDEKHKEIILNWLETDRTPVLCLAVHKSQPLRMIDASPETLGVGFQRIEFHRRYRAHPDDDRRLHVGIDQFGRQFEATHWRF